MSFPTTFDDDLRTLTDADLGPAGLAAQQRLASAGYEVKLGLTPSHAAEIIAMARQTSIREYCPNDSGSRFADEAAVQQWLSKGRATFLLIHRDQAGNEQLAGYGWAGIKANDRIAGSQTTLAMRISEHHQGRGLATPYLEIMKQACTHVYGATGLWLEAWQSNAGAVHVYKKCGFVQVSEQADERPTAGGETVADTRLFMTLDASV